MADIALTTAPAIQGRGTVDRCMASTVVRPAASKVEAFMAELGSMVRLQEVVSTAEPWAAASTAEAGTGKYFFSQRKGGELFRFSFLFRYIAWTEERRFPPLSQHRRSLFHHINHKNVYSVISRSA